VLNCLYELDGVEVPVVALEFNVSLRDARYLDTPQQHERVTQFVIGEPALGVSLRLVLDPPAHLVHFPVETISESEEGLERTYQGLCLVCLWTLEEPRASAGTRRGTERWAGRVRWEVESAS
jgi:hypothetical protein